MTATPKKDESKATDAESAEQVTVKKTVLLPREVLSELESERKKNERSLSAEIVYRLKQTLLKRGK